MITSGVIHAEEVAAQDVAHEAAKRSAIPSGGRLDGWLLNHLNFVAIAFVVAGFALRCFAATRTYLNPDEALHYLILNQSSLFLAYKASLGNAHPPLIYLVLYFWRFLGRSEWMLRLPSVIAGTAFCWISFKWIGNVFGKAAGLIGLILCAFSPAMVALFAELRAYALLLFCISGALYFLDRAFAEKSVRQMWRFTLFLYLSILSHYSAVFFATALGVYALARIADSHLPRKAVIAWASGQAGALAIYGFLYVTHISKIKTYIGLWAMPYDSSYFHPDAVNLFTFTWKKTFNIFQFLFAQEIAAYAALTFFVAGVAFLFGKDLLTRRENIHSSRMGILLLFPFIAVWGASIAGIYPYTGSRHTVFLAPFVIAGASYLLAAVSGQRLWAGLALAILLMALSSVAGLNVDIDASSGNNSPAAMASAVSYMKESIPRSDLIFVDSQSGLEIPYYFCGPREIVPMEVPVGDYSKYACNGYSIIALHIWKLIPENFQAQFQKMARSHSLKPGDRVWVYQTGWGLDLGTELAGHDVAYRCLAPRKFGGAVTVTPFVVGLDFSPESPIGAC